MNHPKAAKKRVCVAMTEKDHARLTCLAQESGRTAAGYLRWLLHQYFQQEDEKNG